MELFSFRGFPMKNIPNGVINNKDCIIMGVWSETRLPGVQWTDFIAHVYNICRYGSCWLVNCITFTVRFAVFVLAFRCVCVNTRSRQIFIRCSFAVGFFATCEQGLRQEVFGHRRLPNLFKYFSQVVVECRIHLNLSHPRLQARIEALGRKVTRAKLTHQRCPKATKNKPLKSTLKLTRRRSATAIKNSTGRL